MAARLSNKMQKVNGLTPDAKKNKMLNPDARLKAPSDSTTKLGES